jgi:hypothetical protein
MRPLTRPGDVAEAMPGMFAVQHAGGGKANQFFVRGFDADHGTDVAIDIDGVPVNMLSHAHGQGYADMHWLVPELVSSVDVRKGPYEVYDGDLVTAGAIDIHLVEEVKESRVMATYGLWNTARGLAITGVNRGSTHVVVAGEAYTTDGPFLRPENLVRFNGYAKVTVEPAPALRLSVGGTAYGSGWSGSGQLPLRAVEAGELDPFGTLDRSEGGQSARRNLYAKAELNPGEGQSIVASAWTSAYRLNLFSNFTFFAEDPVALGALRGQRQAQRTRLQQRHGELIEAEPPAKVQAAIDGMVELLAGKPNDLADVVLDLDGEKIELAL